MERQPKHAEAQKKILEHELKKATVTLETLQDNTDVYLTQDRKNDQRIHDLIMFIAGLRSSNTNSASRSIEGPTSGIFLLVLKYF